MHEGGGAAVEALLKGSVCQAWEAMEPAPSVPQEKGLLTPSHNPHCMVHGCRTTGALIRGP